MMSEFTVSTANIQTTTGIIHDYMQAYIAGVDKTDKLSYLHNCRMIGIPIPDSTVKYSGAFNKLDIRIPDITDWHIMFTTDDMNSISELEPLTKALNKAHTVNADMMNALNANKTLPILTIRLMALYFAIRNLMRSNDYTENNRSIVIPIVNQLAMFINDTADMLIDEPPEVNVQNAGVLALTEAAGTVSSVNAYTDFNEPMPLDESGMDLSYFIINETPSHEPAIDANTISQPDYQTDDNESNENNKADGGNVNMTDRGYLFN